MVCYHLPYTYVSLDVSCYDLRHTYAVGFPLHFLDELSFVVVDILYCHSIKIHHFKASVESSFQFRINQHLPNVQNPDILFAIIAPVLFPVAILSVNTIMQLFS